MFCEYLCFIYQLDEEVCVSISVHDIPSLRYKEYAREAETNAIRAGLSTSAILGGLFFVGLGMFGVAFWYIFKACFTCIKNISQKCRGM